MTRFAHVLDFVLTLLLFQTCLMECNAPVVFKKRKVTRKAPLETRHLQVTFETKTGHFYLITGHFY